MSPTLAEAVQRFDGQPNRRLLRSLGHDAEAANRPVPLCPALVGFEEPGLAGRGVHRSADEGAAHLGGELDALEEVVDAGPAAAGFLVGDVAIGTEGPADQDGEPLRLGGPSQGGGR